MEPDATFELTTAEQLRALADPLRQRLLQAFASPRTVKDTAVLIGEPPTKLYHHIDQLLEAGLLRVVSEARRRATVERTFQVSARRFEVGFAALSHGRDVERERLVRDGVGSAMDHADPAAGAVRLLRSSARLQTAALEILESKIAELIEHHSSDEGPLVELVWLAVRRRTGDPPSNEE